MSKELREHWIIEAGEPYKTIVLTQDKEKLEKYEASRVFFDIDLTLYEDMRECAQYEKRPFSLVEIITRMRQDIPSVYFKNHDFHILKLTMKRQISEDRFKVDIKVYENVDPEAKCRECGTIQKTNEQFIWSATGSNGNYTHIFHCLPCWDKKNGSSSQEI